MAIKKPYFLLVVLFLILSSCSIKKPYVGIKINPYYPLTAKIEYLPASVVMEAEEGAFAFDIQLYKTKASDEYRLTGGMTCNGKGGFAHIVQETFRVQLLLIKNGTVIDSMALNPMGTDLDHRMPFKRNFKSTLFDAIAITYGGQVRG